MTPEPNAERSANKPLAQIWKNLKLLKDDPLLGPTQTGEDLDAFNHSAFATAIYKVILDNDPPLSIGLFGAWGIGKSTVLNILRRQIQDEPGSKLRYIYFNAWKYSGDSFRRQFLIEIARAVYGPTHDEVRRLEELNFNAVLKQSQQDNFISRMSAAFKDALSTNFAIKATGVWRFLMGMSGMVLFLTVGSFLARYSVLFASVVSAAGVSRACFINTCAG